MTQVVDSQGIVEQVTGTPFLTATPDLDTVSISAGQLFNTPAFFQFVDDLGFWRQTAITQPSHNLTTGLYEYSWLITAVGRNRAVVYDGTLYVLGISPSTMTVSWTQPILAPLDVVEFRYPNANTKLAAIADICQKGFNNGWLAPHELEGMRTLIRELNAMRTVS